MIDSATAIVRLSALFDGELLSLEILPGDLEDWQSMPSESPKPSEEFPFVLVEGNLGIPKKVVVQLYLHAVSIPWRSSGPQVTIAATTVILILNPAHQTALNTRKCLIQRGDLPLNKELRYSELLLRGTTDCAKQSIIWDHRRWCLTYSRGKLGQFVCPYSSLKHWASSEEAQFFPKITPDDIRHELAIVYHTCETYRRNYHAWNHWHWLIDTTFASFQTDTEPGRMDFLAVLVEAFEGLQGWIDHHPSDYTAMHQLVQLWAIFDHLRVVGFLPEETGAKLSHSRLLEQCLSLLDSFPTHESLQVYRRVLLKCSD